MFDKLLEKIKRVDEIECKLLSIFEGKSWEHIAKALYQVLDDIDTADDMCKENVEAFRTMVMKLQAKKNQFLYSPDGHTVTRVDETISDRIWDFLRENPNSTYNEILDGIDATGEVAGKFGDVVKDMLNKSIYVEDGKYHVVESLKENLTGRARKELELAGMFDKEVDGSEAAGSWNNLCAEAVIELIQKFGNQGHSGMSAAMVRELFAKLSNYKLLSELTDSIDEWTIVTDDDPAAPGKSLYQSRRLSSAFSNDEGKTYWDIDEDWSKHEDENGAVWSGGLSDEEWKNRPMHQSKHIGKEE